jgi:hypothetical protein
MLWRGKSCRALLGYPDGGVRAYVGFDYPDGALGAVWARPPERERSRLHWLDSQRRLSHVSFRSAKFFGICYLLGFLLVALLEES